MQDSSTYGLSARSKTMPRVFALTEPAEDFRRLMSLHRSAALCGYIHQHRFHLTVINSLEEIARCTGNRPGCGPRAVRCCRSCGAPMDDPPLCTRCRLYV